MHRIIGLRIQGLGFRSLRKSIGKGVDDLGSIVHKMCTKITPLHPSNFGFWVEKTIPLFYPLTPQPIPQVWWNLNGFGCGLFKSVHTIHSTNNNNEVIYKDL